MDLSIKRIKDCQARYLQCFSEYVDEGDFLRYRDSKLPDMYDYNVLFLKRRIPAKQLESFCAQELEKRRGANIHFLEIASDHKPAGRFENFPQKPEFGRLGTYVLRSDPAGWDVNGQARLEKVVSQTMLEELKELDIINDEGKAGLDFCIRRTRRRGEVYLSEAPCDSYLCYLENKAVGNVDLMIHKGVAKIEDFAVIPEYRHRKIGTAMLKQLVSASRAAGCDLIYLVADEEDTPKAMYTMLGFEKVRETYTLFWKF